jgi:adenine-specific DNA methylase
MSGSYEECQNVNQRLIEAGFPCHQVGAETQRERGASSALPPLYFLHVWWARRPLTPSRAAILASLLPAGTDTETFIRQLGIERVQALVQGVPWTLTSKLLERIERRDGHEVLKVDAVVLRALEEEQERRACNRNLIARLRDAQPDLRADPVLARWEDDSRRLPMPWPAAGDCLQTQRIAGDPSQVNERIEFAKSQTVKDAIGGELRWSAEDLYAYQRAFANQVPYGAQSLTILDPTAGGGSIPFEALRLGYRVVANDLNPVATAILYATLDYPARYGLDLVSDIERWGQRLLDHVEAEMAGVSPFSPLPEDEQRALERHLASCRELIDLYSIEHDHTGLIYCRLVTCPHCGGEAPLLNTFWLSKEAGDPWGVRVIPENGTVRFETYRIMHGRSPQGEDPNGATVNRGTGQCIHCKQAIDGEEIKRQAQASAKHPTPMADCPDGWQDGLYAVVAVRLEPKLDQHGQPQRFTSGARKGEIKTTKVRYFRPPNQRDLDALVEAQRRLAAKWEDWDQRGLIPTEEIPPGHRRDQRDGLLRYGITHWLDMFTPRQLLGHLTLIETLNRLKPEILAELGPDRGRAVVTYLQFAIDKGIDYNSRQTRWHFSRGAVVGTFGRHDFSVKWTFGEMIFSGPNSGAAWGLSQVLDAYQGMADLVQPIFEGTAGQPPLTILNGTGAYLPQVADGSVDLVCMDPPYYNNVQYAELSDYFYVWHRRTLRDLYPGLYHRRLTDKKMEAVANPHRDGGPAGAKVTYERMMGEIFRECRRTLKDDGLFTLMFNDKSQDAWETLTRSLIDAGWVITACFPVESEGENSMHQRDLAAAASSIFLSCRKRPEHDNESAIWESAFGQVGIRRQIESAVRQGLTDFAPLHLNPVDEMVASYGKALQVLSAHWPVQDGNALVSPVKAMNEASRVVSQNRVGQITRGKVRVEDLDSETAMALTIFGIWELSEVAFADLLNLSRSLGIALDGKAAGYRVQDREIGINQATGTRGRDKGADGYHAPLVRSGSKLRLAQPEERHSVRLTDPQTDWDRLQGLLTAYREGDIPVARAYLQQHAAESGERLLDLLEVWAAEARDPDLKKQARAALYGLGR